MHTPYLPLSNLAVLILLVHPAIAKPRCWYPAVSPNPLIYKECNDIITKRIPHTGSLNTGIPLIFSRDKSLRPDIQIPFTWHPPPPGNCVVGVDIPAAVGGSEKTSLQDIEHAAQAIAVECVIKRPHLGGIMAIGWQEKLNVVITGMKGPNRMLTIHGEGNGTAEKVVEAI